MLGDSDDDRLRQQLHDEEARKARPQHGEGDARGDRDLETHRCEDVDRGNEQHGEGCASRIRFGQEDAQNEAGGPEPPRRTAESPAWPPRT